MDVKGDYKYKKDTRQKKTKEGIKKQLKTLKTEDWTPLISPLELINKQFNE